MANKNALLKVVILGDGGVGKSCLMNRFVSNHFDDTSFHTIGVEFLNKELSINGETYTLQIWDTAGQERFKSLRTPFYRGSDLCLLVYSVDDKSSFNHLSMWKSEFLYYADVKEPSTFPFVVLGNKVDILEGKREVSEEEGKLWCLENGGFPHVETSAKEATNVEDAFTMAVQAWASMEERQERLYTADTVDLSRHEAKGVAKGACCFGKVEEGRPS